MAHASSSDRKSNHTILQFGVHLGGGFNMPLAPMLSADFQGRYVFMEEQATALSQGSFDPDFWSMSAGVSIKF